MIFDVNIINPFLQSSVSTLSMVANMDITVGKPSVKELNFKGDKVLIMFGVTGAMKGQIIFEIPEEHAKNIASRMMMGMPVNQLDEMAMSAVSELGNMIMGNAATILSTKDILIDITTPIIQRGVMNMENPESKNISIPLIFEGNEYFYVNVTVKAVKGE